MILYDHKFYIQNSGGKIMANVPIKVLLVEDDIEECNKYKNISEKRNDINIVVVTNSSAKAIEYLKHYKPDAVILDLELHKGEGSGFDFIENMAKQSTSKRPNIVVTTNVCSDSVYDFCHKNRIDFIFYKKQVNYSQEKVLDTLLLLSGYDDEKTVEYEVDEKVEEDKIMEKINKELELIGISSHLQGKKYLCDAIYFVIKNGEKDSKISIIQHLVGKYKKSNSTISRAMQNAILHAWRISSLEDLTTYYTARINYETGVPTPTELIYYYADKIKKEL